VLVLAVIANGVSPASAAPGSTDPATAPRICSQGTLTADPTANRQRFFVRLEIPTGATVTYSVVVQARSGGAIGFFGEWGVATASNPNGHVSKQFATYQWASRHNPEWRTQSHGPRSWTNTTQNTEFVGFAWPEYHFEYPHERWIATVTYVVAAPAGTGCSSLPSERVIADQLGSTHDGGYSADPVNTGTGNFTLPEADLAVVGGASFDRTYNSMDDHLVADPRTGKPGLLGPGWTSAWDLSLRPRTIGAAHPGLELRLGDGRRIDIPTDGNGGWTVPSHLRAAVVADPQHELGSVRQLRFHDGRVWTFDLDGRILRMEDGGQTRLVVTRNASRFPVAVTAETYDGSSWVPGPSLTLHDTNNNGLVNRASDPAGNQVTYSYAGGRLASVSVPHHPSEYPQGDPPAAVTYVYDSAGRITEVRRAAESGADPIIEVVNTYDGFGRVETQLMPTGELAEFEYGPLDTTTGTRTTTVTHSWPDEPGTPDEVIEFVHDEEAKLIRLVDSTPAQGASDRTWLDGRLLDQTSRGGANWSYAFDDHGRAVQRVIPDPDTGEIGQRDPVTGLFPAHGPADGWSLETIEYCDATDGDPRVRRRIDATGVVTEYRYDPDGSTADPCPMGAMVPTQVMVAPNTPDETERWVEVGSDGFVRSTTDGDGVATEWVYGDVDPACEAWQLCAMVVAPGTSDEVRTEYRYDTAGRLSATTVAPGTPLAATTTYAYDAGGRLVSEAGPLVGVDPAHHPVEYRYDLAGRLVCTSDQSNPTSAQDCDATTGSWFTTYDDAGRVESVRDPDGVVTLTEYVSVRERRVTVAHGSSDAATTTYRYGPLGRLQAVIDPVGVTTQYCHDIDGAVVAVIEGLTSTNGEPDLVDCGDIPSGVRATVTELDRLGRVTSVTDSSGVVTGFRYDRAGRQTHIVTAQGTSAEHVTETTYDGAGRASATLTPPPNVASFDWWNPANDAQKVVTQRAYTPGGRLASVTAPNPNRPFVAADPQLEGLVWSDTVTTTFSYDQAGRRVEAYSPLAGLDPNDDHGPTVTEYDAAGRVSRVVSPAGRDTAYHYDLAGRVVHVDRSAGDGDRLVTSMVHDPLGRVVARSVPHASVADDPQTLDWVNAAYSAGGRLLSVWDPNDHRTDYSYDARGNRVGRVGYDGADPGRVADPSGLGVESVEGGEHDLAGRAVAQWREDPGSPGVRHMETTWSYVDPVTGVDDGRLRRRVDGSGRSMTLAYSGARVASRSFSDGVEGFSLAYGYDAGGRVVSMLDSRSPSAPVSRTFDVVGNLLSESDPVAGVSQWRWGVSGNVMERTGGFDESFFYDLDGRMAQSWSSEAGFPLNVGTWRYDADGLVVEDTILEAHWSVAAASPVAFAGRRFVRDDAGRVVEFSQTVIDWDTGGVSGSVTAELGYDTAGRLASELEVIEGLDEHGALVVVSERDERFGYDPAGQLVEVRDGANNQLGSWVYGPGGRRVSETTAAGLVAYEWDALGRLVEVAPTGGDPTAFGYDGAGRRDLETTGDLAVDYVWDPAGRLVELSATDTDLEESVWSETRAYGPAGSLGEVTTVDHLAASTVTDRFAWDPTWVVPQVSGWSRVGDDSVEFGISQGPGGVPRGDDNVQWLVDVRGSLLDLDGDGSTLAASGWFTVWGGIGVPVDPGVWVGYRGEVSTTGGLVHLRNRDYDPTTGVFLTPDPLDGVDGTPTLSNPYHYTDNDPLNRVDPLGLRAEDDEWLMSEEYWDLVLGELDLWNQYLDSLTHTDFVLWNPSMVTDLGPVPEPGSRQRGKCGVLGWVPAQLFGGCELTARNTLAEIGGVAAGGTVAVGCAATFGVATVGTGMALCGAAGSAIGGGVHDALDGDPNTNPFDLRRRGPEAALGGGSILAGRLVSSVVSRSPSQTAGTLRVVEQGVYESRAGLRYGPGSIHGHRLWHVMQHGAPDATGKASHSVFVGGRTDVLRTVDEAWIARGASPSTIGGREVYVVPMGRTVGTAGERHVTVIVEKGTSNIVTAFPSGAG
jgi:RHS repeat-associated protein